MSDTDARPGPVVRAARYSDGVPLCEIDRLTWTENTSPAEFPTDRRTLFGPDDDISGCLVAELDGEVAGYVEVRRAIPIPAAAHVQEIGSLAVAPAAHRRGVGRALLGAARGLAARRGARKIVLRVLGPNTAARALYRSCGYTEEGVLKAHFHLGGRDVDDVQMALFLPAPQAAPAVPDR